MATGESERRSVARSVWVYVRGRGFYSFLTLSAGQESADQCVRVFVHEDKGKRRNRECTYV